MTTQRQRAINIMSMAALFPRDTHGVRSAKNRSARSGSSENTQTGACGGQLQGPIVVTLRKSPPLGVAPKVVANASVISEADMNGNCVLWGRGPIREQPFNPLKCFGTQRKPTDFCRASTKYSSDCNHPSSHVRGRCSNNASSNASQLPPS